MAREERRRLNGESDKEGEGREKAQRDATEGGNKHCYKSAAVERNPWYASHRSIAAKSPTVNFAKTDRKLRQYFREILTRL